MPSTHFGHHHGHEVLVRIGTYHREDMKSSSKYVQTFGISAMVRHPDWIRKGDDEFRSDFLLLKLNGTTAALNNRHQQSSITPFVRINRREDIPLAGHDVTAMGMGVVDTTNNQRAQTLQQVQLTSVTNDDCEKHENASPRNVTYAHRIDDSMLCTEGGPNNERDAW